MIDLSFQSLCTVAAVWQIERSVNIRSEKVDMNDVKERVASNLSKLRQDRAKNRVSRSKASDPDQTDLIRDRLEAELKEFLGTPASPRPIYCEPIVPVFFGDPPPAPAPNRNALTLAALAKLYPIERRPDGTWSIICSQFYIEQLCKYNESWENDQSRIRAVLFHAAKLTLLLSMVLQQSLLYPIRIDGPRAKIRRGDREYDVVWYESRRDFFIALNSLNADAKSLANVNCGENNLLENLKEAMTPRTK
jgi:hypothetical protein